MKNKKVLGCLLLASMAISLIPQSSFAWGWPWKRNECCCEQPTTQVIVQEKVIIKEEPKMEEPAPMMVEEKVEMKKSEEMVIPQDPGIAQPEPAPDVKETKYYPGLW